MVLCLAAIGPPASAEKLPLSMRQAVEIATEPDGAVRVQLAMEAVQQAEAQRRQARAALLPNIDGSLSWENRVVNLEAFGVRFGVEGTPFQTPSKVGPFDVVDARAQGRQTVFNLSAIRRYQAASAGVAESQLMEADTRDRVAARVAKAYLAALQAEERVATAEANVALAEELLELAENQKAAGTGTGIDITRAQVQLSNERQLLLVAENARRRAHLELQRAMDLRLDAELELTDRLIYHPVDAPAVETAVATALGGRSDWRAQEERERRAERNLSAAKWARLPAAWFYGNYGAIGSSATSAFPTRTIGVRVDVPVFDGGRVDAQRAEAGVVMRQEKIRTADLRAQIDLEIRLALDMVESAAERVGVAMESVELAENELAQARRRFQAGVTNSIEVTDAQNRLARARDVQVAALFEHESARLDLGAAIGKVREYIQ